MNSKSDFEQRIELPEPGPMLPPVPAIILGVKGDEITQDDLTCVWTFVLEGKPPQVGISVGKKSAISGHYQVALDLIMTNSNTIYIFGTMPGCYVPGEARQLNECKTKQNKRRFLK